MPGQPVKIGPFIGGMNTYSGPSSISDNEAVEIINMDIDLDGSLSSRPPLSAMNVPSGPASNETHVIGTYRSTTNIIYIIYAFSDSVYAYDTSGPTWILISNGTFTTCEQYLDKLYLVQKPSGTLVGGGKWDPVGGYVAIATMPRGYDSCIYKERMFVSASRNDNETSINRVKFSNPANPDTWTSTDYLDVSAGDGQDIAAMAVYDGQIVIFKSDSTYVYAYESSPSKGLVQIVNGAVGANNRYCVVEYENNLFVMHENKVYRIGNWNWEHANVKVPFEYRNSNNVSGDFDSSLSLLNNRLLCRYYDNYYALGLKTGAWTKWEFPASRKNLIANSSFEVDTGYWVSGGNRMTLAQVADSTAPDGSYIMRLTNIADQTALNAYTYSSTIAATAGHTYTFSLYFRSQNAHTYRIRIQGMLNGLYVQNVAEVAGIAGPAGTWVHAVVTGTMPAGTDGIRPILYCMDAMLANEYFDIDAAMVEESTTLNDFIRDTLDYYPSEFVSNPNVSLASGMRQYYSGTYVPTSKSLHGFIDVISDVIERMSIKLVTKAYDFGPSYAFKRLYWWGVDILSKSNTTYKVSPLIYNTPVTWGQVGAVPISQLQTWGRPLDMSLDVTDSANTSNPSGYRTFIKLLKSLRFRQASFTLEASVDGTSATGPYKIFSLTAFVDSKEVVSKKVS